MVDGPGTIIAVFPKNNREAIGVCLGDWRGELRIDIRTYVQALGEEHLVPTQKGVSLKADYYQDLLAALRKLGGVMSSERLVATLPKSKNQVIRVGVNSFRGKTLVYIRQFRRDDENDEKWKPMKKGISVPLEEYPELLRAVEEVEAHLTESHE